MKNKVNAQMGYLELSLAQIFLAIHIVLAKMLASTYSILSLLMIKFLTGSIILIIYIALTRLAELRQQLKKLNPKEWTLLCLQSLCGGGLFNILNLYGLKYTTAIATSIINSTLPAFVAFFSFLILKENLTKAKIAAISLSVIGILLLNFKTSNLSIDFTEARGIFFAFLAIIPAAFFIILAKMTEKLLDPFSLAALINVLNVVFFLPLTSRNDWHVFFAAPIKVWLEIIFYGISGSVLFFVFWYRGLRYTAINTAALFIGIMPIFASVLAYTFLSENFSRFDAIGMFCVILAIFIGTSHSSRPFLSTKNPIPTKSQNAPAKRGA